MKLDLRAGARQGGKSGGGDELWEAGFDPVPHIINLISHNSSSWKDCESQSPFQAHLPVWCSPPPGLMSFSLCGFGARCQARSRAQGRLRARGMLLGSFSSQGHCLAFPASLSGCPCLTSLMSVQVVPLPEYPGGQGPQRKPVPVSVQVTPGKQGFGRHLLNCVTVMTGPVASVWMPGGQEGG